jgi:di/tricarboxylate transporter
VPTFEPATIVLITIAVSLLLFVTESVRYDLIAVGVAVALAATGVLSPKEAFAGFSSPAVMLIASMYVFGAALTRWGVAEALGARILVGGPNMTELSLIIRVIVLSALLSGLLSNAGVVAILIPVLSGVGRRKGIPASKLLMPLAFGSLMGGLLSVIATSKNLAINGLIVDSGHTPLGLFEFTPYGLVMLAVGVLYFVFPGRQLLPSKRIDSSLTDHYQVRRFVTEVLIEPNSTLINRSVADSEFFRKYSVTVIGIVRPDSTSVLAPGPYNRIRGDDTLILQGEPDDIMRLRRDQALRVVDSAALEDTQIFSDDVQLLEAVVPANSDLCGRTIKGAEFQARTGLNVLAISKHGAVNPGRINEAVLEVGDTLLIQGHTRDIDRVRISRELLTLGELEPERIGRGAMLSIATLFVVLVIAFFGWMPLSVVAVSGALFLLITNCVPGKDIYNHIDWQALILIGGMLSLGHAFQVSRLDSDITDKLQELHGFFGSPRMMIALLMLVTIVLTQVTTHIAAAAIMTPVALAFAERMGVHDRAFIMAVLTGSSLAYMSPVAHQANAMVVGPGDYKYRHFLRVGTPLVILQFAVAIYLIPLMFPL